MPAAELHSTLLSDGSSDRALIPILEWLLRHHLPQCPIQPIKWADLRRLLQPPRETYERILTATRLFPCDLLFVHRDAENASINDRQDEIDRAMKLAEVSFPGIAIIPVRMMEAWLLIDEPAIRRAAGNPNGRVLLNMPAIGRIESITDPKNTLHDLITTATELPARRKNRFNVHSAVHRIPEYIGDFSPLRDLSAFAYLEEQIVTTIRNQGWDN